jgi:RNA polymerase sigma-70 factor (ECF subfamily)
MDRYEPRGQLAAYLFTIARRVMADRLREKARPLPITSSAGTAAARSPDEEMEAAELKERVSGALLQLSDKLREVVVLRIYDGMSYAEISGITGVGESTLQSRLLYALEELRHILRA